ncbi:class I sirtuins SIR2 family protein [Lentinula raphanica]|nr:class I sirtuins SIR2 family protein [Lentinula raphanica]
MAPRNNNSNDLKALASHIKSGECKKIALMLGAGVSTAAGIPDFRSLGTGLYANLARLKLPYPEAVFEINFFRNNPVPFYTLAHELYPGKFRPTLTHAFIRLLSEHSLLSMCFTQNIDTLERRAGVPHDKIIEAHGSFATQRCIKCQSPYDDDKIKELVVNFAEKKVVPRCERKGCRGLVKPDIVFFGESLPPSFSKAPSIIKDADLLIVIGTSLTVHPFASLAMICPTRCPRVLINIDRVGNFGSRKDDVVLLGKCDEIIKELCEELGWEEELMRLWDETAGSVDGASVDAGTRESSERKEERKEVEKLEEEVAKLAEKIQKEMGLDEGKNDTAPSEETSEHPSTVSSDTNGYITSVAAESEPSASAQPARADDDVQDTERVADEQRKL